jgi:ligand-binding SRPBCC domain-containing protein
MKARSASDYLARRRPRYRLTAATSFDAPLDEVFAFFSRPENLGAITPARMAFSITESSPQMGEGATIAYRLRVGGVPVQWRTQIERWAPGESFVDVQLKGPYHCWWHEHRFVAEGPSRTLMLDTLLYTPPMGILGRIANRLIITGALRDIFAFRADAIRLRFGAARDGARRLDASAANQPEAAVVRMTAWPQHEGVRVGRDA